MHGNIIDCVKIDDLHIDFHELCPRYGIQRIEVFGSFARGDAGTESDLDLIVKFEGLHNLVDRYFGFKHELEALAHRVVDMVPDKSFRNPIFAKNVNHDRRLVYG